MKAIEQRINDNDYLRDFYLKKLQGQAVAESFLGRYEPSRAEMSKRLLRPMFKLYAAYEYADLTTMHNLLFLKEVAFQNGQRAFTEFDDKINAIGRELEQNDSNNPYLNYYLGRHYEINNNADSARYFYRRVAEARNFERWWYTNEADEWLKAHPAE